MPQRNLKTFNCGYTMKYPEMSLITAGAKLTLRKTEQKKEVANNV